MSFHEILYPQKVTGLQKKRERVLSISKIEDLFLSKIEEEKKSGNKYQQTK